MMKRTVACLGVLAALTGTVATQTPGPKAAFDAADVYVRGRSAAANPQLTGGVVRNGRYDLRNATMVDLITTAYGVTPETVVGGPNWLEMKRFDIVARVSNGTNQETLRAMLQTLLADRFKLEVHKDTRPLPGYALTIGPGKHKLKEAAGGPAECTPKQFPPPPAGSEPLRTGAVCRNITMDLFANMLRPIGQAYLSDPATNKTGLDGTWDFEIEFTPRSLLTLAGADATTLFEALDKQLGLKLAPQETPSAVLVVDSVNDQPTANPSGAASNIPAPPPAEFDVASIKLSAPGTTQTFGRIQPGGRIGLDGATLENLVLIAWNFNDTRLIANAPSWFGTTRYSINAIASNAVSGTGNDLQIDFDDLSLMLQALLKERFQMKTHMENRPVEAYTLVADKPKLQKANPVDRTRWKNGPAPSQADPRDRNPVLARLVSVQNMTMAQFAEVLQPIAPGYLSLPVEDGTGLEGSYTFTFNFSPINAVRAAAARPADGGAPAGVSDPNGAVSLFDALQKQLGLKLELRKRSMPVLVIDQVEEKPIDN